MKPLKGKIALVAGATRGAGRGIASALGEAGAAVYCTGRSSREDHNRVVREDGASPFVLEGRPETIEETAEIVTQKGGFGIPVRVDHTVEDEVKGLFQKIREEQGRLDIVVNDIWGGDALTEWGTPFWELTPENADTLLRRSVWSHIVTSRYGVPLMLGREGGLVIEITDTLNFGYKGNLYYDLVKQSVIRLAFGMAEELQEQRITSVAITPGFLRSEAMLEHFGVTENNWQEGGDLDIHFLQSETPLFIGRGIAALAADPNHFAKTGQVLSSWGLAREYNLTDADGRRPDFGAYFVGDNNEELASMYQGTVRSHNAFVNGMQAMPHKSEVS